MYKKGTYLGQADQSLGADAINKLQSAPVISSHL